MKNIKDSKFALLFGWLIGAVIMVLGFFAIISNVGINYSKELYSGILYVMAGLIVFPPFDKVLQEKIIKKKIPGKVNGLIFLVLVIIAESI